MDIAEWLKGLGLPQYVEIFVAEGIDLSVVGSLSDQDLKDLGVALMGHRRKIITGAAELKNAGPACVPTVTARASSPLPKADAERRPITVMFCDLVGSTSLAAKLDAEDWRDLVGAYLDEATGAVDQYGGHVLKKLGDGIRRRC
jgi:class 3 adenylate cyclase